MDGILLIHKEANQTSHDVVSKLRNILHISKIGHSGTLDPNATGVLMVLVGKACKALPFIQDTNKTYVASLKLGSQTDTDDQDGEVINTRAIKVIDDFDGLLKSFMGKQMQMPPMISAIKVKGKKLYEYARANEEVERVARAVEIFDIKCLDADKLTFSVKCSSGTYIRSLCVDLASKSGNLGHMGSLVRSQVGRFTLDDCYYLRDIEKGNFKILPTMCVLDHYKMIEVDSQTNIYQGKKLEIKDCDYEQVVLTHLGNVLAIYEKEHTSTYRCKRGLW